MFRRIDRYLLRVPSLSAAVTYYRDVLGFTLTHETKRLATFKLHNCDAELLLHTDPDQPAEAVYWLVDDVRDLYQRREELNLTFVNRPTAISRGYRATVKDPFGIVHLILDRTTDPHAHHRVEDASTPATLFAGVEPRIAPKRNLLIQLYEKVGRTADDLPYTPHFESIYVPYADAHPDPKPSRAETWRHLLNLRKSGKLPKLGEARSRPPEVPPETIAALRNLLAPDLGKRDRLPYTERFDKLVDHFNRTQPRPISPHLIWRLVATLAK